MFRIIPALFTLSFILSCQEKVTTSPAAEEKKVSEQKVAISKDSLKTLNGELIQIFKSGDFSSLPQFIHPQKGIRFSMYAYVNKESDKHFSLEDFQKYIDTDVKFTFGHKDGTGDVYITSLKDYLQNWVWKKDFSASAYTENTFQGSGNSLNNLQEVYPSAEFTENYIAGTEQYSGMDWNSLRFVFEKYEGKYYLVAILNDEWTT